MQLFYAPNLENGSLEYIFPKEESKHIIKVLRKKEEDTVYITNGKGYLFEVKILIADLKNCKVAIISTKKRHKKKHSLHVVVAPTKMNERFEWFLEKATEIGVTEITPIICARSERKTIKKERMERVLLSAMKQSLQTYLPTLNEAISFNDYIEQCHEGLLFIAHCEDSEKMELKRRVAQDKDIIILIGPEGDFSNSEIHIAQEKGFLPVSLGENRLRTETAAVVACTIVQMINTT